MKKIYSSIIAIALYAGAMAQSAPGAAPATFNSCNANSCTAASSICPAGSPNTVTNFNDRQYVNGTGPGSGNGDNTGIGATWRFYNVATDNSNPNNPLQVNATITVEALYQADITDFDNNSATNQNNATLPNLFAPSIRSNQNLSNTDRNGYAQFRITFYKNTMAGSGNKWNIANYTQTVQLAGLNYVHYDIDGLSSNSYQLRETGVVQQVSASNPVISVNANSELNAYNYSGDAQSWRGFMGSTCNRDNTSSCAQVVAAFKFNAALSTVVFRMGYNYDRLSGNGINDRPERLYASTFGCFTFPQPVTLPVKLLSFTGSYNDNTTNLKWETEAEESFSHYEIERSLNGSDFSSVGKLNAQAGGTIKKQYQYADAVSGIGGSVLYYRLKMVDIDQKFKYSNVIIIRRDTKSMNGISISPNPIAGGGNATVRMSATTPGQVDVRVIDMMGKIVLTQQSRISEGTNSIAINNINRLQTGTYTVQVVHNDEVMNTKISIIK